MSPIRDIRYTSSILFFGNHHGRSLPHGLSHGSACKSRYTNGTPILSSYVPAARSILDILFSLLLFRLTRAFPISSRYSSALSPFLLGYSLPR